MNQIRKFIQTKIDNIIQLSDATGDIDHNPTVGELRESYLLDFFRDLIPDSLSVTSGFVADAKGIISPQLDLIVTQKSALPLMNVKEGISIVPVESAILVAEIKSTLSTSHLGQIKKQNSSLASMQLSGEMKEKRFIIPTVILAYDTDIAHETIKSWLLDNGNTVACCIFKKRTYFKDREILVFENEEHGIRHHNVLAFISTFHKALNYLVQNRDFEPNLDMYLTGYSST